MSNFKAKNTILFPNKWALESFLLKLKRSSGWEYHMSNDADRVKVLPKGAADYVLIELLKNGVHGLLSLEINAERAGKAAEETWTRIFDYARKYRC